MSLNIVLVEPEIPANTGNIVRTCSATGTTLHLVHPLGFSIEDKYLKRAGLDYWHEVSIHHYDSFQEVMDKHPSGKFFFASTKARQNHSDVHYQDGDFIVFGKETKGLPEDLVYEHLDHAIRIPMKSTARSLNLSNSVAIVLYEAYRQLGYWDMK